MTGKIFKAALVAMSPDANPEKHRSAIQTSIYELTSVLARDEDEAVAVCRDLVKKEGVQSIILCPGFTHRAICRVCEAVGQGVSINVARGDGPSNAIAQKIMSEAGFFVK